MSDELTASNEAETVEVKPEKMKIDLDQDQMTLGDLETFEEVTGMTFSSALKKVPVIGPDGVQEKDPDPAAKGAGLFRIEMASKGLLAMVYISLKRDNPDVTMEYVRSLKLGEIDFGGEEQQAPPLAETETKNDVISEG